MMQNPTPSTISAHDVQRKYGETIDRVRGGETIIVTSHSRPVYALVPIADFNTLTGRGEAGDLSGLPEPGSRFAEPAFDPAVRR